MYESHIHITETQPTQNEGKKNNKTRENVVDNKFKNCQNLAKYPIEISLKYTIKLTIVSAKSDIKP